MKRREKESFSRSGSLTALQSKRNARWSKVTRKWNLLVKKTNIIFEKISNEKETLSGMSLFSINKKKERQTRRKQYTHMMSYSRRLEDNLFYERHQSTPSLSLLSPCVYWFCGFHTFGVGIVKKKHTMCFILLLHFVVRQLEERKKLDLNTAHTLSQWHISLKKKKNKKEKQL